MGKHTPGPWQVISGYQIYSALGGESGDGVNADSSDGWHIASIGEAPTIVDGQDVHLGRLVQRSNAHLIAAAPDLLEALESALTILIDSVGDFEYDKARAAIAKAKGEQP